MLGPGPSSCKRTWNQASLFCGELHRLMRKGAYHTRRATCQIGTLPHTGKLVGPSSVISVVWLAAQLHSCTEEHCHHSNCGLKPAVLHAGHLRCSQCEARPRRVAGRLRALQCTVWFESGRVPWQLCGWSLEAGRVNLMGGGAADHMPAQPPARISHLGGSAAASGLWPQSSRQPAVTHTEHASP